MDRRKRQSRKEALGMSVLGIHVRKDGLVSDKWESYLYAYDQIFSLYRDDEIRLLEIGVQNGGSLETWADYFWDATEIIGIDTDPKCGELEFEDDRIKVIVGDSKEVEIEGEFDIIIDDGSHTAQDIIANFNRWWPKLANDGIYVVEDFHTQWMPGYGSHAIQFFAGFIQAVNDKCKIQHNVQRLEFRHSMVILEKGEPWLGNRLVKGKDAPVNPDVLRFQDESKEGSVLQHQQT